ncbi:hypothetical protein GY15_02625 [Delftia sp. 670]|nr:hypothetical protein GY15_02625 [Delftia sp. 670]
MRGARHDGAHFRGQVLAVQHLQRLGALDQARQQLVGHVAHEHSHADGHAALAGRAVAGADQRVHGLLDIGIGHDHHVVLGAAQGLHALAVARARLVDVVGNGRGAHEAHRLHVGMLDQRIHGFLVALHHVEHAVRQARLLEQVGDQQRRCGIDGAGLEHEGVARRNGHREHPHRHHHREIEGRDARDHAQGLAQRPVVDAGGDLVGEIALEQLRNAAGEFHDVDAAADFALRIGEDLAVLGRDRMGQLVLVLVEQLQEAQQHACTADGRRIGPLREGRLGRRHGGIDIGARGQGHAARDLAGGRVGHVLPAVAGTCRALAVDVVDDGSEGGVCGVHARQSRSALSACLGAALELIVQFAEQSMYGK